MQSFFLFKEHRRPHETNRPLARGIVTVGVGEMLASAAKVQTLPFLDPSRQPSTRDAIRDEFNRVSSLAPGQVAAFYRSPDSPVLPDATIDMLLMSQVHSFDAQLAGRSPAYASFPDTAKLGLLDMIYNLGATALFNGFPGFLASVEGQDWLGAGANCHRVGPSHPRNDAAAIDPGSNAATALADPATAT